MKTSRAVFVAAVAALGVVVLVSVGGATAGALDDDTEGDTAENASLGVQTGSFMQASSASTESAVIEGMFDAEYDRAEDSSAVLDRRAAELEDRIHGLEQRKAALEERDDDDVVAAIRMSRIATEIHSIDREVEHSAERAEQAGHAGAPFDELSAGVDELRGPEVAAAAGATPGGPPMDELGPPNAVPGGSDDTGPPAGDEQSDRTGPSDPAQPDDDGDDDQTRVGAPNSDTASSDQ